MAMKVLVKLFATLRKGRFKNREFELSEGTTVLQVLDLLAIIPNDRTIGIIFINGKHAGLDSVLQDGDALAIFPPVAGG